MKYDIFVWADPEASIFILDNTDVIEAALNFLFWDEYNLEVKEFPSEFIKELSRNDRNQLNIGDLISKFREFNKVSIGAIDIVFISVDLYYEGREYIFSATHIPTKTIVISLYRLSRNYSLNGYEDSSIIRKRIFKELLHELGHLMGLDHCSNSRCVMSFSPDLYSLDEKLPFYCNNCVDKLKRMGYKVLGPEGSDF
jgi:archaemetzincin